MEGKRARPARETAKRILDVAMTALSVILMGGVFLFPDDIVHEALGTTLIALWILHHVLNRGYYKSIFKGKYSLRRAVSLAVNLGALVSCALLAVSGPILSGRVFAFLDVPQALGFARTAHLVASHWYFCFIAFHFALHVPLMFGQLSLVKKAKMRGGVARAALIIIPIAVSAYGAYAFISRGFARYMFYRQQFFFLDIERGYLLFAVDYITVFVMFATVFYWLCRLPEALTRKKR